MTSRRWAVMKLDVDALISMFQTGSATHMRVVECGLPLDAKIVRCGIDSFGMVRLIIESGSFQPIADTEAIPVLHDVIFTRDNLTPEPQPAHTEPSE